MHFKIHRGTKEIGGSCVEIWTKKTRIVIDIGMPLVESDGKQFDFGNYKVLSISELIEAGILPDIQGFYPNNSNLIDGLIISHAHLDHYGLFNYMNADIPCYLGRATNAIIELSTIFTPSQNIIKNACYFEKSTPFIIGDLTITAYWMDHSAFDAYAFLIESDGKSLFYSGDFRNHGRKANAFKWFLNHAPTQVDCLLLEGTQVGRSLSKSETESEIEEELTKIFNKSQSISLIYTSGQNIDRLVSIYRACVKSGKLLVLDIYTAAVLKRLSEFAALPFPSKEFIKIRVIFPYYLCKRLTKEGNEKFFYQFQKYKITKKEIKQNKAKIVMTVRPSMKKDLAGIENIDGGKLIYSLWEGYLKNTYTANFIDYLKSRQFEIYNIHTSGHADIVTLQKMVNAIKPKKIVPIHTFQGNKYSDIFEYPVNLINDREIVEL